MRMVWFVLPAMMTAACASGNAHRASQSLDYAAGGCADPTFLEQYAATRRFSSGFPTSIKIVPDGSEVLFLRSGPRNNVQDLYAFDTTTGKERVLLTAEQILEGAEEKLSAEELARRERMRMSSRGIATYQLSKDGTLILVPLSGRLFVIERASGNARELKSDYATPIDARFSPDGRSVACVRDGNLFVINVESGEERQLTTGADAKVQFGLAEFVAQEEMDRREGYWWSPDSAFLAYQRTDTQGMETMHIMDAMRPEVAPQKWPYPRAGQTNAVVQLGVVSVAGGETTWIRWDRQRFPYLATVRWSEKSPLTVLVQNRAQTEEGLLSVNTDTGATTELLIERDEAWLNLDQKMPKWLSDGSAFLWTTERDGAWQLELRSSDGSFDRTLTKEEMGLKGFLHLDSNNRNVFLSASDDPTQTHVFRLSMDASSADALNRMTSTPGAHSAIFAEKSGVHVLTSNTLDGQRTFEVRDASGTTIGRLRSVAEDPPFIPNIELTRVGRNPDFHAVLIRPRNFDSGKQYPVIDSVYGGPHSQTVQAAARNYLLQQWIADHGFIVVSIDGRGTPSRGRAWERSIKGNLIDIPLADQIAGLKALGRKYSELDLSRVGIYGWSFGGYFSAMAAMRRPDVFSAGVAGAPVCDWRDYDTHYTERYMGLPDENADGYDRSSVLSYCKELSRPLLIIHGTADDNVYFMHSLKMSGALFRAGHDHEFLALSDFTHMVADPLVTSRLYARIVGFFLRHLVGIES